MNQFLTIFLIVLIKIHDLSFCRVKTENRPTAADAIPVSRGVSEVTRPQ